MVKCAFCVCYINGQCIEPRGVMYNKDIEDPYEEIDCPYYLDIAGAGILGMGLI